jgi:hypothetical protein
MVRRAEIYSGWDRPGWLTHDTHTHTNQTKPATTLILLNWVIQLLAASQTDILRQQAVSLEDQLEAYPLFVHALKQVHVIRDSA